HAEVPLPARRRIAAARLAVVLLAVGLGAPAPAVRAAPATAPDAADAEPALPSDGERAAGRGRMVAEQIAARGVSEPALLAALRAVPRHRFGPPPRAADAYADRAGAIGHDATISQPCVVAVMTGQAPVRPGARVLEVGTGSGY